MVGRIPRSYASVAYDSVMVSKPLTENGRSTDYDAEMMSIS